MTIKSKKNPPPPALETTDYFVFLDRRGKRWPQLRLVMLTVGILFFVGLTLFAQTLFVPSKFKLPVAVQQLKSRLRALQNQERPGKQMVTLPVWLNFDKDKAGPASPGDQGSAADSLHKTKGPGFPADQEIRLGFYENWDPDSLDSLRAHADQLTHVSPDWLTLADGRGQLQVVRDQAALEIVQSRGLVLLPLLSNMAGTGNWLPDVVEGLINGPDSGHDKFTEGLLGQLQEMGAGGVVINFEDVDPSYREAMTAFLSKVAASLHAADLELWLCVPMGQQLKIFDLDTLAEHVDRFVAMLHDENAETDPVGPIASREWFNGWLDTLVDEYGEPLQWVAALGSYGYDWTDSQQEAMTLSFEDVMSRALRSGLAACEFDKQSANPHFAYENADATHTVWFLDAATFLNQLQAGREHHVGGVAISRLGTEDPGIWQVLGLDIDKPLFENDLDPLTTITPQQAIANFDRGNFLSLEDERAAGRRHLAIKRLPEGEEVVTERYEKFPSYTTIVHQGSVVPEGVAITFDDGPDAEWTPPILDILQSKGVKATFFMVGANMEQAPDLVRRIVREGHTIGVHTYTHPNIALVSAERAKLEFNATQRLVEALTGHSTILFRPPYNADTNPHEPEELVPIKLAQTMGYITVSEDIDPEDWARPGAAAIVANVKAGRLLGGDIVLLHDAGGDRSQTVEALPQIIDYLRVRGDSIVSLPEMLGVPIDQLMPTVPKNERSLSRAISAGGFTVIHTVTDFFWAFMLVATALVVLRTLVVAALAIRNRRQDRERVPGPGGSVAVSVLIAAYNEEKVISETLAALLSTTYAGELEILVVDDGSTDQTALIVAAMASREPRLRLRRQANAGKATALQNGLAALSHDLVICLDADTQFEPSTIFELVCPLNDPAVGAVSGRARVGNAKPLVARFQSLEYTCGFNLDRRAYHQLNCITVVPGAVSALRKSAVLAVGGISTDTLAEDTDLTLSLHKGGFKVYYAPRAVAWTEAPETIRAFAKQRFRWAFGTLQCLWKHRDLLFNSQFGALAWFSLPSAWFFNIFLVAIGPLIDVILLLSLIISPANTILYLYFGIFLLSDLLLAAVACWIEQEPLAQIRLVLPMRFIYRPVLSYAVARAIIKAIKGVWVGWGKLDRTASVHPRRSG